MENENVNEVLSKLRKEKKLKSPKESEDSKRNVQEVYSEHFQDNIFLEAYYDPETRKTGLLLCENGNVSQTDEYDYEGIIYTAPPPTNPLLTTGFVKLPSGFTEYGSDKELNDEIRAFLHKYVQLPEEFEEIVPWYIMFTWVFDSFRELPYLRVVGDFGCGKSRFLFIAGSVCYRPIFLNGSASVSAVFRIINEVKGTIVFDEADFQYSDTTNDIIKILNAGFQKGTPVFRSEENGGAKKGKSFAPTPYDVFSPKILGTRRNFADGALESRCLTAPMVSLTRKDIPENLDEEFEREALAIRNKLTTFRFRKLSQGIKKTSLPSNLEIEPRLRQIITPIYSVIEEEEGRNAILQFITRKQYQMVEDRYNSPEGELFRSFLKIKEEEREPTIKAICDEYNSSFAGKFPIKSKTVGERFEQIFHLEKKRNSKGYIVLDNEHNEKQIEKLRRKYGIGKGEMNDVNLMNMAEEREATIEDVEKEFGVKGIPKEQGAKSDIPF
jgi:hypothetical protein